MTYKYTFNFRFNLSKADEKIETLINELNETMQGFGFNDKLQWISGFPLVVTASRELTKEEEAKLVALIKEHFLDRFAKWDMYLENYSATPDLQ